MQHGVRRVATVHEVQANALPGMLHSRTGWCRSFFLHRFEVDPYLLGSFKISAKEDL